MLKHHGLSRLNPFSRGANSLNRIIKRHFHLIAIVTLLLSAGPLGAAVINGVNFTSVYDGTVLPTAATPAWTLNGSTGTATATSGILDLDTPATGTRFYRINYDVANPIWNGASVPGSDGSTIEFSLRVDSLASGATAGAVTFYFSTGTRGYAFNFFENKINTFDFDTTSSFNIYRVTVSSQTGLASLFINNSTTASITGFAGSAITTNSIYFGDASNAIGGNTKWDYLAFTNQGMFNPVPEPASMALIVSGLLFMAWAHKRSGRKHRFAAHGHSS